MQAIIRRLRKLEERFGPAVETECTRRLRERIEAGRRRLAQARERGEWCGSIGHGEREDLTRLSVTEVLHRGRAKVARAIGPETAFWGLREEAKSGRNTFR